MKHQYSFKISSPCSEKWDEMQANPEGKFCSHCEKTVVNFMQMTENEIATFLHLNKSKKICGAIYPHQQTQKYHFIAPTITESPVKRYVMAMLSGLLLTVPYQAKAVQLPLSKIENIVLANTQNPPKDSVGTKSISGKVIDKATGKPIAFLSVKIDIERALNVWKINMIDEIIRQHLELVRQKNKQNAQFIDKEQLILNEKIKTNEADIQDKLARWNLSSFKARTDKDGSFSISLPEDMPELDLNILFSFADNSVKEANGQTQEAFSQRISVFYIHYKGGNQYEEMEVNRSKGGNQYEEMEVNRSKGEGIIQYIFNRETEPTLGNMYIKHD